MSNSRFSALLVVCALGAYVCQGVNNGISPALATIASEYPDIPMSSISLLSTLPILSAVIGSLASSKVVEKVGYKATCILSSAIILVCGCLPGVVSLDFYVILGVRFIMGLGLGLCTPIGAALASAYFQDLCQRSKVLGWGTMMSNLSGIVFAILAGYLIVAEFRYVWFVNLLMVIPLVIALFMPKPDAEQSASANSPSPEGAAGAPKEKIPAKAWFFILGYGLIMLFHMTFILYVSSLIMELELGTAVESGYAISLMSVSGAIAGLVFGSAFKKVGRYLLGASFALLAASYACFSFGSSLAVIFVGALLAGFGLTFSMVIMFTGVSVTVPPSRNVFGQGLTQAFNSVMCFAAPYFSGLLASLLGQAGSIHFPFYLSLAVFGAAAVYFLVRPKSIE